MKKLLFILVILCCAFHSQSAVNLKTGPLKGDTVKIEKELNKLNLKLADLRIQLAKIQAQIPIDSAKLEKALSASYAAQVKSRRRSEQAIGGDLDDVKLAEKQAKKASKQTREAEDAAEQLERNRKKAKGLVKEIGKTEQKLDKVAIQLTK